MLTKRGNATFKGQQAHCNLPAFAHRTNQAVGRAFGIGEEGFVEFRITINLLDRANLNARLINFHHYLFVGHHIAFSFVSYIHCWLGLWCFTIELLFIGLVPLASIDYIHCVFVFHQTTFSFQELLRKF